MNRWRWALLVMLIVIVPYGVMYSLVMLLVFFVSLAAMVPVFLRNYWRGLRAMPRDIYRVLFDVIRRF